MFLFIYNPHLIHYKNARESTIFTLKEDAKVLLINNTETVLELIEKYPSYHHILGASKEIENSTLCIDYEKLSQDYDGIYLDYHKVRFDNPKIFESWSVSTLLLFNLDCIKEYQRAQIHYELDQRDPLYYIYEDSISDTKTIVETEIWRKDNVSLTDAEKIQENARKIIASVDKNAKYKDVLANAKKGEFYQNITTATEEQAERGKEYDERRQGRVDRMKARAEGIKAAGYERASINVRSGRPSASISSKLTESTIYSSSSSTITKVRANQPLR